MANGENGREKANSAWADLLTAAGRQLIPVLLTAGSLIGFVAFAGSVIVWTRFSAAKVPPDQAVNAVPRGELVALGSTVLLLGGFFGVLALIGAFLVDRGARATPGMARALLLLFLVESVTVVVVDNGLSFAETVATAELIALPVAAVGWATLVRGYVRLEDDLPARLGERTGDRAYKMFLLTAERLKFRIGRKTVQAPLAIAWTGIAVAVPLVAVCVSSTVILAWLTAVLIAFGLVASIRSRPEAKEVKKRIEKDRFKAEKEELDELPPRADEARRPFTWFGLRTRKSGKRDEATRRAEAEREKAERIHRVDAARLRNERPERLMLEVAGVRQMAFLLVVAVGLPCWRLHAGWIAVSIVIAAMLTSALWRIATLASRRVIWYGVAVFLSVPLLGTLTAMARNLDDPQVQPMALIRSTDGPDEAIQGIYVAEAGDRVYFASVATEGCTDELTPSSGRLEWVPKSEVVAMSVGPLQSIDEATDSALEMSYALTPAVETPAEGTATLTASERADAVSKPGASGSVRDKRLEDAGPAVRPNFGAGLTLTPENASPGDRVTLQMSTPNPSVEGFGRTRNGHTVRVGGVRTTILKEYAHRPDTAEYLEVGGGALLRLEKDEPYVRGENGGFERLGRLSRPGDSGLYLKLVDNRVISVDGKARGAQDGEGREDGVYLPIHLDRRGAPVLNGRGTKALLRGAADGRGDFSPSVPVRLMPHPKTQAWHERQIRFVVPENASTGAVTVECSQLAGQPLLRVAHAPEARLSVHMQLGSRRVSFQSKGSHDVDNEELVRHWNVAGLQRGDLEQLTVDLPPRPRPYVVRMTVSDKSGRSDTAEFRLLRLPASLFALDVDEPRNGPVLAEARETLERDAQKQVPTAIEIDGHADDPGSWRHNVRLSLHRAVKVRTALLAHPHVAAVGGAKVPVRTVAYGEGCPVDPRLGRNPRNRRVDIFVIDRGVRVEPPAGCHPRRLQSTVWRLPTLASTCAAPTPSAAARQESLLLGPAVLAASHFIAGVFRASGVLGEAENSGACNKTR